MCRGCFHDLDDLYSLACWPDAVEHQSHVSRDARFNTSFLHTLPQSSSLLAQDKSRDKVTGDQPQNWRATNPRTAGHRYVLTWTVLFFAPLVSCVPCFCRLVFLRHCDCTRAQPTFNSTHQPFPESSPALDLDHVNFICIVQGSLSLSILCSRLPQSLFGVSPEEYR